MTETPAPAVPTPWDTAYSRLADLASITHPVAWHVGRNADSVTITPPENDAAGRTRLAALSQYHHWAGLTALFSSTEQLLGANIDPLTRRRCNGARSITGHLDFVYRLLMTNQIEEAEQTLTLAIAAARDFYTKLIEPHAEQLKGTD